MGLVGHRVEQERFIPVYVQDHPEDVLLLNMSARKNQRMHQQTESPLFPFWVEDRGLIFFLAFLVLVTIVVPMITLSRYGRIGLGLMFALMLFSGAVASIRKRIPMCLVIVLTVVEFTAELIVEFNPSFSYRSWDTALKICGLAILVVMTLKQTFRPGPVSAHRVMGGVAAYLLIGLTWAFGYKLLMEERPDAIHFQTFVGGIPTAEPSRLIYFSFSTLTSLGYGDASQVHRIARSLTTAEALIGQLYPAILIATLVGLSLQARTDEGTGG